MDGWVTAVGTAFDEWCEGRIVVVSDDAKGVKSEAVLNPRLLEVLVCPIDKQPVRVEGTSLVCTVCRRVYPIEDGIPNMLVDGVS